MTGKLRSCCHSCKTDYPVLGREENPVPFQCVQVIEEREKLKNEREARQKQLYSLRTELDRLRRQQGMVRVPPPPLFFFSPLGCFSSPSTC